MNEITAFLPCRAGSQRILKKNTREFAKSSLFEIKLLQLLESKSVTEIVVSSNDEEIFNISNRYKDYNNKKIINSKRPDILASSETTTDELINYVCSIIKDKNILWTHVTAPFVDSNLYDKASKFFLEFGGNRSLMSVKKIQNFCWMDGKRLNYKDENLKWPFTQKLKPIYEITNGFFYSTSELYNKFNDRICNNPYLFEISTLSSIDIDNMDDFQFAEELYLKNYI